MLASLAPGVSRLRGVLTSEDARSSARVLRQLGAVISPLRSGGSVTVRGHARFQAASAMLDCGNSGTTARLLLGLLAAHRFTAELTGDASLRRRPMRRVTEPLIAMGARVIAGEGDGLPLRIAGGNLHTIDWRMAVASAQIKSALLLASAAAGVPVTLRQPAQTRDHTERMLREFGFTLHRRGLTISCLPTGRIEPFDMTVPGDPSSAIFLLAAAVLSRHGSITIADVGLNPTRIGFLTVLERMGIAVRTQVVATEWGEPRGTLSAGASSIASVNVAPAEVPGIIDEIPMLACLAARGRGTSRFSGLAELRVKESDRLALIASNLRSVGVVAVVEGDDLIVTGSSKRLAGPVITHGDHRIAMAFAVLGSQRGADVRVDDPDCAAVSFPGFDAALSRVVTGTQR